MDAGKRVANVKHGWLLAAGAGLALMCGSAAAGTAPGAPATTAVRLDAAVVNGPVPAGFRPQSVTFVSANEGWVLGTAPCHSAPCTSIVATGDGGRSWHPIPAPRARLTQFGRGTGVGELRFAGPLDGFAYDPDLYFTHDGGASWHRVRLPGRVGDLEASGGVVYAAVRAGRGQERIYRSAANTNAWSMVAGLPVGIKGTPGEGTITLHGTSAWIFIGSRLYATSTGTSWFRVQLPCDRARKLFADSVAAFDTHRITLLCTGLPAAGTTAKVVYASGNGGHSFSRAGTAPSGGDGGVLAEPAPAHIFIASSSGATFIYVSRNGGRTWQTSLFLADGGKGWNDFGFTTATQGIAVEGVPAIGSHLYLTRNGGRTWRRIRF
jgi:photosystem II stability/assembly factor-like uncharacterized protein